MVSQTGRCWPVAQDSDLFIGRKTTYKWLLNRKLIFTLTMCMPCEVNNSVSCVHFAGKHKNEDDIRNIWSDIVWYVGDINSHGNISNKPFFLQMDSQNQTNIFSTDGQSWDKTNTFSTDGQCSDRTNTFFYRWTETLLDTTYTQLLYRFKETRWPDVWNFIFC